MDEHEDVFQTICRVCLSPYNRDTVSLLDENCASKLSCYGQSVLAFANVSISPVDQFPTQMCYGCLYLLRQAIRFKFSCEQTHQQLTELVSHSVNGDFKTNVVELSLYHQYLSRSHQNDDHNDNSGTKLKKPKKKIKDQETEVEISLKSNDDMLRSNCNQDSNSGAENVTDYTSDNGDEASNLKYEDTDKVTDKTEDYDELLNQLESLVQKTELKKKKRKKIERKRKFTKVKTKSLILKDELKSTKQVKIEDNEKVDNLITLQELVDETDQQQSEEDVLSSIEKVIDKMESIKKAPTKNVENIKMKYYDRRKRRRRRMNPDDSENYCQSNKEKKEYKSKVNVPQQCNICNKTLANTTSLLAHVKRHKQHKYICEHCGKSTTTNSELQSHLVARHGTGRYMQCDLCDFKSFRKYDMSEHVRTHTGERPFACDKCGLTFTRQSVWRRHRRYHMEKRFTCPLCPRRFHFRGHMKQHSNNVHSRQYMFACPRCGAVYAKPSTVRRHLADKHNVPREEQGKITKIKRGEPGANFSDH